MRADRQTDSQTERQNNMVIATFCTPIGGEVITKISIKLLRKPGLYAYLMPKPFNISSVSGSGDSCSKGSTYFNIPYFSVCVKGMPCKII